MHLSQEAIGDILYLKWGRGGGNKKEEYEMQYIKE